MPTTLMTKIVSEFQTASLKQATDFELLRNFAQQRDRNAMADLIDRHGSLVWGVCGRQCSQLADREDAFQATFLALARQAHTIDDRKPLACWLHTVAHRVARKAKARAARQRAVSHQEPAGSAPSADLGAASREIFALIDQEVENLPDLLRTAVVLCCLEERSREEAASLLGCSVLAVKSRLERARDVLRHRLVKRGVAVPAAFLTLWLTQESPAQTLHDQAMRSAFGAASPAVKHLASAPSSLLVPIGGLFLVVCLSVGVLLQGIGGEAKGVVTTLVEADEEPVRQAKVDAVGDPLPKFALARFGTERFQHPATVQAIAVSPNGKTVVSLANDMIAWDVATGRKLWKVPGRDLPRDANTRVGESRLQIDPTGKLCIALTQNSTIGFWDLSTGILAKTVRVTKEPEGFRSITISPNGERLIVGSDKGSRLIDTAGQTLAMHKNVIPQAFMGLGEDRLAASGGYSYAQFSPTGKTILVVSSDNEKQVLLCDETLTVKNRIDVGARYFDSAFSPKGDRLAIATKGNLVRVYQIPNPKPTHEFKLILKDANENYTFKISFSPDGGFLLVPASDRLIHVLDLKANREAEPLQGHSWYPTAIAFGPDGKTLFSSGWEGTIYRWDWATKKQLPLPVGVRGNAETVVSPNGYAVAFVDNLAKQIHVVETETQKPIRTIPYTTSTLDRLAFSPDSRSIALAGTHGGNVVVRVVDLAEGKARFEKVWPQGRPLVTIEDFAFSPDGTKLAGIQFRGGNVKLWDFKHPERETDAKHHAAYGVTFHPQGKSLISVGWDGFIRTWDADALKSLGSFQITAPPDSKGSSRKELWSARMFPDGKYLAVGDLENTLSIIHLADKKAHRTIAEADLFRMNSIDVSRDGVWLATGGAKGAAKIWDAGTGKLVWDQGQHTGEIHRIQFVRDGRRVLSAGTDQVAYLWDTRPSNAKALIDDELWIHLVGADAKRAFHAYHTLLEDPAKAETILTAPIEKLLDRDNEAAILGWINDLDSDEFMVRNRANEGLVKRIHQAQVQRHLREAFANAKSVEHQRRLERMVRAFEEKTWGVRRAIGVLGNLTTPTSRALLKRVAAEDANGDLGLLAAGLMR